MFNRSIPACPERSPWLSILDPGSPQGPVSRRDLGRIILASLVLPKQANILGADDPPARSKFNRVLAVGDDAPEFDGLLATDGKRYTLADFSEARVIVVFFIRNLCPTTHVYEARVLDFARSQLENGVRFVAISVSRNPAEGLDRMGRRAKDKNYIWPYLYDESQYTGRVYGASVTPQFFVLDGRRKIAYMGAFDDHFTADKVTRHYVADAVKSLLNDQTPPVTETLARGCEIEYAE